MKMRNWTWIGREEPFLVSSTFFKQKCLRFLYFLGVLQDHDSDNRRKNLGKIVLLPILFLAVTDMGTSTLQNVL